jgi:hypothetical protein
MYDTLGLSSMWRSTMLADGNFGPGGVSRGKDPPVLPPCQTVIDTKHEHETWFCYLKPQRFGSKSKAHHVQPTLLTYGEDGDMMPNIT